MLDAGPVFSAALIQLCVKPPTSMHRLTHHATASLLGQSQLSVVLVDTA